MQGLLDAEAIEAHSIRALKFANLYKSPRDCVHKWRVDCVIRHERPIDIRVNMRQFHLASH